jgi:hypothetical protein
MISFLLVLLRLNSARSFMDDRSQRVRQAWVVCKVTLLCTKRSQFEGVNAGHLGWSTDSTLNSHPIHSPFPPLTFGIPTDLQQHFTLDSLQQLVNNNKQLYVTLPAQSTACHCHPSCPLLETPSNNKPLTRNYHHHHQAIQPSKLLLVYFPSASTKKKTNSEKRTNKEESTPPNYTFQSAFSFLLSSFVGQVLPPLCSIYAISSSYSKA